MVGRPPIALVREAFAVNNYEAKLPASRYDQRKLLYLARHSP